MKDVTFYNVKDDDIQARIASQILQYPQILTSSKSGKTKENPLYKRYGTVALWEKSMNTVTERTELMSNVYLGNIKLHTQTREQLRRMPLKGVSDDLEMLVDHLADITLDDDDVIFVHVIQKKFQPSYNGWRWKFKGDFIGQNEPKFDYLYDEPVIEDVYVWNTYKILDIKDIHKVPFDKGSI